MPRARKQSFGAKGWPEQAIEMLKEMRGRRESLQKIAEALGITRSMVSGKVRRLKLPSIKALTVERPPAEPKPKAPRKYRHGLPIVSPALPSPPPPAPPPTPAAAAPPVAPLHIRQLRDGRCRATVEQRDLRGLAMYCGRDVTTRLNGTPSAWCPEHYKLYVDLERMERHGKARSHL